MELVVDHPKDVTGLEKVSNEATVLGALGQTVSDEMRGESLARAKLIESKIFLPKRLW